jgi:hypothetical protein
MKRSELTGLVREVMQELDEANVTGGSATFTPGDGAQYATPKAFSKNNNRAVKYLKKLGYKKTTRPKRPSHTKGFDYL